MSTSPELLALAAPALVPPMLNTSPLPEYGYDRLDYGMTIGIERTSGGRLWACWVGGGDSEDAYFVLATSDDEGNTWSAPRLVINPHDEKLPHSRRTIVGNLWLDPKGRLWLFFDQAMTYFDGRAGAWYARCDNPDSDNPQWTQPVRMWHGCSLNKPIVCSNGEWLIPLSLWDRAKMHNVIRDHGRIHHDWPRNPFLDAFHELDPLRMAHAFVSRDEGATWERRGGVKFPKPDFDEHNLIESRDGSIWITARTGDNHGMWHSVSRDGGRTWSAPALYLENCSSRHFMRRLASGRLLMIKHGQPVTTRPPQRSHLVAYLSEDDGQTWLGGLMLDERDNISYPDGTQAPDGRIFISYDRNRGTDGHILLARFTEEDVLAGRLVSPGSALRLLISSPNPAAVAARHAKDQQRNLRHLLGDTDVSLIHIPAWLAWDRVSVIEMPNLELYLNNGGSLPALAHPLPPETHPDAAHPWKILTPAPHDRSFGPEVMVSLTSISPAREGQVGYARAYVFSPDKRTAIFVLGADFWMQFRVNGEVFLDHSRGVRPFSFPTPRDFRCDAPLRAGWNLLEVKVASGQNGFTFACQINDTADLRFATDHRALEFALASAALSHSIPGDIKSSPSPKSKPS